ncbi:DUF1403 family protein [uncultured Salipiger sp.]|uniref:DUF1403 family protein n=1 Tax=uncultured Salipiger sp. TaxID=499810 RepID=UPI002591CDCB|nr:DUF1403 family protein [uncultured Salipiger sp.]
MTFQPARLPDDTDSLPQLPGWVTSGGAETPGIVAFRSGAALLVLDQLLGDPGQGVPVRLLANRLALSAATATSRIEGRLARESDIRDAYHLTPPGEARGPDGDLLAFWRDAARLRSGGDAAIAALTGPQFADACAGWLRAAAETARTQGPLAGCSMAMAAVLEADPRAERVACLLSDVVLARAMGWKRVLPVTAQRLQGTRLRDLGAHDEPAALAVQAQLLETLGDTIRLARTLTARAEALRAKAPKLRAKGAEEAVALFLSEDAVAPGAMLSPRIRGTSVRMTDRAARRFCDRLVALGLARELTGRATFRLYGL